MTKEEFLTQIQDVLQREEPVSFDCKLEDLQEWDSLAMMSVSAFLNINFGVTVSFADLKAMQTIEDIYKKAGL